MPSAKPLQRDNNFRQESRFNRNIQYGPKGSSEAWIHKHPSIQESFFLKIDAPTNANEASIKRQCHEQSVSDFNLQIEIIDHEMSMLREPGDNSIQEPNEEEYAELEIRKLKLLMSKRYHQNASHAYWYFEHMDTFS
jgi:hypothetical protein